MYNESFLVTRLEWAIKRARVKKRDLVADVGGISLHVKLLLAASIKVNDTLDVSAVIRSLYAKLEDFEKDITLIDNALQDNGIIQAFDPCRPTEA